LIRHLPIGLGHPYRVEPFQRFPINPIVGEPWTLRVCTDESVKGVVVHVKSADKPSTLELTRLGHAKAEDPGPYGLTAKEYSGDSHLEDAALRSGDYPNQISWSISMPTLIESQTLEYSFETEQGESTEVFLCHSSSWEDSPERRLSNYGAAAPSRRIAAP